MPKPRPAYVDAEKVIWCSGLWLLQPLATFQRWVRLLALLACIDNYTSPPATVTLSV